MQYAEAARAAVKWPVVDGVVTFTHASKSTTLYYDYYVSGKAYRGRMFSLPRGNALELFNSNFSYKHGQHVLVYFDPAAPDKSSLHRELDEKEYTVNLIYSCIAIICGVSAFGCFINDMTNHKAKLGFK